MTVDVGTILTVVQAAVSLCVFPLMSALWSIHGRLSNIEGVLHGLEKKGGKE